jgi:hypothetical protein
MMTMWYGLILTGAISRAAGRIAAAFHPIHRTRPGLTHLHYIHPGVPARQTSRRFFSPSPTDGGGEEDRTHSSSYDVDVDEEAEQLLSSDHPMSLDLGVINGDTTPFRTLSRYADLVQQVGLSSKLTSSVLEDMPNKRPVSPNDIFCNRELKMGAIRAIGFDMDYTLAQYQQPAFDSLAFEGAKRKLVDSLGYPKEVLDLQYDHNVCSILFLKSSSF